MTAKEFYEVAIKLRDDMDEQTTHSTEIKIDGRSYPTDVGYAFEGIDAFLAELAARLELEVTA